MVTHNALAVRELGPADEAAIRRILDTSEYIHCRFDVDQLGTLLARYPAVGLFTSPTGPLGRVSGGTLQAFLMVNWLVPPSAWIGGFGVTWSQGQRFAEYLDPLLAALSRAAVARGAHALYYSGGDVDNDWLCSPLEERGFTLVSLLRSYDKADFNVTAEGAAEVLVRPFTPDDLPGVLSVENAAFDQLWRHDAASFLDVARTYPYFVVAEQAGRIVGYQFNTIDSVTGYLVRIAVHPTVAGRGVGTRLMAEAVRYFERHRVWKIVLNTEERNERAHRLYEWFGFYLLPSRGFVLGQQIG